MGNLKFHPTLLEKLLDNELIYTAEYLDLAVDCLELADKDLLIKTNFYLTKLKSNIDVEENQLRLLEKTGEILTKCYEEKLEN